jgi:multidrug resistance protein
MKKGPLVVLILTVFIDLLGFGIVVPFLAFYAQHYGASGRRVGAILAIYSLMQFFFSPLWGRLSDRIGRRPVLIMSLAGSVLGYTIFAFSRTLLMLFIARMVAGIAAANIGTAQAYVADVTTPEERSRGMGLIGAAFGVGFIFGPPLGGLLSRIGATHHLHENLLPGVVSATLSLIALTIAITTLPESKPRDLVPRSGLPPHLDRRMWAFIGHNGVLPLIYGALFLVILAFSGMEPLVTLHATNRFHFTPLDLGWLFLFMGIIVASIQGGVIGRLTTKIGEPATVICGAASLMIGLSLVPSVYRSPLLYAVAFLIAIGQGLCYPSLTSLLTKVAPKEEVGSLLGISSSIGSLSRVVGPILAGFLYDRASAPGGFYGLAVVVAMASLWDIALRRVAPAVTPVIAPEGTLP